MLLDLSSNTLALISRGSILHIHELDIYLRALKRFKVRVSFNFSHTLGIYFYKEDNPPDFSWLLPTVREIYGNPPCWHQSLVLNTNLMLPLLSLPATLNPCIYKLCPFSILLRLFEEIRDDGFSMADKNAKI